MFALFSSFLGERNCPRQVNSTLRGFKKEDLLLGGLMSALGDFLADKWSNQAFDKRHTLRACMG